MRKIQILQDIVSEHKRNRMIVFSVLALSFMMNIIIIIGAFQMVKNATNKVYILENGKALLAAYKTNIDDNRPVELRNFSKNLVRLLFTISPDKSQIEENLKDVSYLGDSSILSFIKTAKEAKYYDKMIASSASSKIVLDTSSIRIDYTTYPFKVEINAKNYIIRTSTVEERDLICFFQVRNIPRSDNNPHGLLAERFFATSENVKNNERN